MSDLCLDTCPTHYTRNRYACQQKVLSLQQEACLPQGVQYPPVSVLTGAEKRVKVDAAGENGERLGGVAPGDELGHIVSAGKLQGAGELAVKRVLIFLADILHW